MGTKGSGQLCEHFGSTVVSKSFIFLRLDPSFGVITFFGIELNMKVSGMAKSLKKLLGDSDGTVRWKATEVLFICSNHAIGRDSILEFGLIQPISALFDDKHDDARLMSHRWVLELVFLHGY